MYLHSVSVRAKRLEAVWDHLCEPKASALGVFAYRASPSAASGRSGVACILQGNVAPEREKRQGGSELKRGQGMGKVREKFNGFVCVCGGGDWISTAEYVTPRAFLPQSFFFSFLNFHSCPVSSCMGWCWEELQECFWGFPNFAPMQCTDTHLYTLFHTPDRQLKACRHAR